MIIALSYTVLTWERQQSLYSLLQVQCQQLGKWLVLRHSMRVAWIALPVVGLGLATVLWFGPSAGDVLRAFLWAVLALTYLLFWGAVVVCATVTYSNSQRALLGLTGTWLVLVVLLPALASNLANLGSPAPSYIKYVDAMRNVTDEARAQGCKLLANYVEDHPELAAESVDTRNFFAQRFVVQMNVEQALQPFSSALQEQRQRRHQLLQWLRFLSPALLATDGLVDAAGAGPARHQHFRQQVSDFHQQWRQFFGPHILSNEPFNSYSRLPQFEYRPESLATVIWRFLIIWAGLLVMCVVPIVFLRRRGFGIQGDGVKEEREAEVARRGRSADSVALSR